jgi:hypothetical protein
VSCRTVHDGLAKEEQDHFEMTLILQEQQDLEPQDVPEGDQEHFELALLRQEQEDTELQQILNELAESEATDKGETKGKKRKRKKHKKKNKKRKEKKRGKERRKEAQIDVPSFHRYLYAQTMRTRKHHLCQSVRKETKKEYDGHLDDIELVESQLSMDIGVQQFYVFKNFDTKPHGSAYVKDFEEANRRLAEYNIPCIHIRESEKQNTEHDDVKVLYKGNPRFDKFLKENTISQPDWVDFVLHCGKTMGKRDDTNEVGAVARRFTIGFTTNRYTKHTPIFDEETNVQEPNLHTNKLKKLPTHLRRELNNIIEFSQGRVDEYCSCPYRDADRSRRFGKKLFEAIRSESEKENVDVSDSAGPEDDDDGESNLLAKFEYVDIYVEAGADLKRHMDYKNDGATEGYSCGASYSFYFDFQKTQYPKFRKHIGKTFRVNFIFASRSACGNAMRRIENVKKNL